MRTIQILGTGCPKCEQLAENTRQAADELGLEYQLEKVTDVNEIMKMGVAITPALAVDGEVKMVGKVGPVEQIKSLIQQ